MGQSRHRNRRSDGNYAASASPTQAVARPNSLRGRPPTRRPAGSFLGGFRTPALRAHTNRYDGPVSETLHQEQPMLRLVAARSRRRVRSLWRARTARPGRAIARPGATNRLLPRGSPPRLARSFVGRGVSRGAVDWAGEL